MTHRTLMSLARSLATAVCVMAIALPVAEAKPVTMTAKSATVVFTKVNAADPNAEAVYVTFEGGLNKFNAVVTAPGFTVTPVGAGGTYQLTGGNIANGGTLTLSVRSRPGIGTLNGIRVGDVIFQDAKGKALASGKATGGTLVGDPIYTLYNDLASSSDLLITNLHFYFDHAPVDFDTLDPASPLSGAFVSASDALLTGSGTFKDYAVPSILDGKEFLVQGDVISGGVLVSQFVDGYSVTGVPEPASALLMSAGLLGMLTLAAARRRT